MKLFGLSFPLMAILMSMLLPVSNAAAAETATTCYKAQPARASAAPPTYFLYDETFCISDIEWREEGDKVRFDFAISYETNYSESWPFGRRQRGPFKLSKLLPLKALEGGFGWVLIWDHNSGYTDCNPPASSLRCRVDFDLRVGGIGTPNLKFSGYSRLTQKRNRDTTHSGTWTLIYQP
jgi:hypothetical protein